MTVAELQNRISYNEFVHWIAYIQIESKQETQINVQPVENTSGSLLDKFRALTSGLKHDG